MTTNAWVAGGVAATALGVLVVGGIVAAGSRSSPRSKAAAAPSPAAAQRDAGHAGHAGHTRSSSKARTERLKTLTQSSHPGGAATTRPRSATTRPMSAASASGTTAWSTTVTTAPGRAARALVLPGGPGMGCGYLLADAQAVLDAAGFQGRVDCLKIGDASVAGYLARLRDELLSHPGTLVLAHSAGVAMALLAMGTMDAAESRRAAPTLLAFAPMPILRGDELLGLMVSAAPRLGEEAAALGVRDRHARLEQLMHETASIARATADRMAPHADDLLDVTRALVARLKRFVVVAGSRDPLFTAHFWGSVGGNQTVVPEAGHFILRTHRAACARAVSFALRGRASRTARSAASAATAT